MSRVVPSKLTAYSPMQIGVSNKNFHVEYTSLLPANSSSAAEFRYNGTNRILFRIPAFQNCFADNSRSSLSFTLKTDNVSTGDTPDASTDGLILNPYLGTTAIFSRMLIKNPSGLVIEDIQDIDLLNKVLMTMQPASETRHSEGIYLGDNYEMSAVDTAMKEKILADQKTGVRLQYMFNIGILSRHLQAYLPLHSMNAGNTGLAFSIELWVNDPVKCLTKVGGGTSSSTKGFSITNLRYNLTLLKADRSIIDRFNNLANDSQEIVIPFSTYRSYVNTLSSVQKASIQATEACSDLRRVHTVLISNGTNQTEPVANKFPVSMQFVGGIDNGTAQIKSYQLQVGSHFIYSEPIISENDNSDLLQQVINASFSKHPINATKLKNSDYKPAFYDEQFSLTSTFAYENPSSFVNGISLGSLPLVLRLELNAAVANLYAQTFSELGFNLVIKDGYMMVRDSKDIEDFGY